MGIELVRIDDRLIHGQVVTTWMRDYNIEQVAVVNDLLSQDPVQGPIIKLAAPPGTNVVITTADRFAEAYKNGFKKRTLVLLTGPEDVLRLIRNGVHIPMLNVGGMRHVEGRRKFTDFVYVNDTEFAAFSELTRMGVDVQLQMVPNSNRESVRKYVGDIAATDP